jgi:hypothetical protein
MSMVYCSRHSPSEQTVPGPALTAIAPYSDQGLLDWCHYLLRSIIMHEWASHGIAFALVCSSCYIIFGRGPRSWKASSLPKGFISILCFVTLIWTASYVECGGLIFWWPDYSERDLLGLTPEQVIARLGPPDGDPRQHGWRTEDKDGPLEFGYGWNWAEMLIDFTENHVTRVSKYWK